MMRGGDVAPIIPRYEVQQSKLFRHVRVDSKAGRCLTDKMARDLEDGRRPIARVSCGSIDTEFAVRETVRYNGLL